MQQQTNCNQVFSTANVCKGKNGSMHTNNTDNVQLVLIERVRLTADCYHFLMQLMEPVKIAKSH